MKKKEMLFTTFLLLLDQGTKGIMANILSRGTIQVIPSFFELTFVKNTGASWGILGGQTILLIIVSLVCLFVLAGMFGTMKNTSLKHFAVSFLYAGIIGNLLDRIVLGYVRDFLSFTFGNYSFPVFNFADICIVCGGIMLLLLIWKDEKNHGKN